MRNCCYFIILIALFACKKDEPAADPVDVNFTDLHDTTLFIIGNQNTTITLNLDIDKDSTNDLVMTDYNHYSSFAGAEHYWKITPENGYAIGYADTITTTWIWNPTLPDKLYTTDTLMIPKVYNVGDTISITHDYTQNALMISYSQYPTGPGIGYSSGLSYSIPKTEGYFYFAFLKTTGNKKNLAWLKVKFPVTYGGISFNSCTFIADKDKLIIK